MYDMLEPGLFTRNSVLRGITACKKALKRLIRGRVCEHFPFIQLADAIAANASRAVELQSSTLLVALKALDLHSLVIWSGTCIDLQ